MKPIIALSMLRLLITVAVVVASLTVNAASKLDDAYNPRDEVEYSYRATLDRQEQQATEIEFKRYQQQEQMQQRRLMNQQDMYNQTHQRRSGESSASLWYDNQ